MIGSASATFFEGKTCTFSPTIVSYNNYVEEIVEHLFLHYEFSKSCWGFLGLAVPLPWAPFRF
jgi:hypothetical protein